MDEFDFADTPDQGLDAARADSQVAEGNDYATAFGADEDLGELGGEGGGAENDGTGSPEPEEEDEDYVVADNTDYADAFGVEEPNEEAAPAEDDGDMFGFDEQAAEQVEPTLEEPVEEEETPLSRWEDERETVLAQRRANALERKDELISKARSNIENARNNRQTKIEKTATQNRTDEQSYRDDLANTMEHGTEWQKVAKMCNLAPKSDKSGVQKDRMRRLLIQLKSAKDSA